MSPHLVLQLEGETINSKSGGVNAGVSSVWVGMCEVQFGRPTEPKGNNVFCI